MTNEPRWDPGALDDLRSGYDWYEARELGLGRELTAEIQVILAQSVGHPFLAKKYEHPNFPAEPEVRKIQLSRFDEYGLVYAIVDDVFWVLAIAHAKRKPGYWIDRLKSLS
ncbi:MAG: type II toxin-antitoxin system RelE/ParE family toxin [Nocardioidaceae bacterium]|nr:MAG: type II toxin-antitoxin system RelE/ParE family toxin [Nocardioidaceae bacterium]